MNKISLIKYKIEKKGCVYMQVSQTIFSQIRIRIDIFSPSKRKMWYDYRRFHEIES